MTCWPSGSLGIDRLQEIVVNLLLFRLLFRLLRPATFPGLLGDDILKVRPVVY